MREGRAFAFELFAILTVRPEANWSPNRWISTLTHANFYRQRKADSKNSATDCPRMSLLSQFHRLGISDASVLGLRDPALITIMTYLSNEGEIRRFEASPVVISS